MSLSQLAFPTLCDQLTDTQPFSGQRHATLPYLHVQGDIPPKLPEGSFVSIERTSPPKIYSLGFQPAKSIPEIARWFLNTYMSRSSAITLLEPFAGAGTTIIEGLRFGASIYWLDYHPLSRLICRVKTTPFSPDDIRVTTTRILEQVCRQDHAPETIQFANKDFWFQKPVQEGLEIVREHILRSSEMVQPALWLAFASTVRKTSDMNDSMLLAARRPHIEKIPQRSRSDVFKYFQMYVDRAIEAIAEWNYLHKTALEHAHEVSFPDARCIQGNWFCDAVVTSPPYINAIDYVWSSKFELHWLGLVQSDQDRLSLYTKEIGTERIAKTECKEKGETGHKTLDQMIEAIYNGSKYMATKGQNQLRARVVYQYFIDMKRHFASSFSRIRPGGYYCFSIGEMSKICGVDIPVASILTDIACDIGFEKAFSFHILLRNRKLNIPRNVRWAGTIKHDTVVVLKKPFV